MRCLDSILTRILLWPFFKGIAKLQCLKKAVNDAFRSAHIAIVFAWPIDVKSWAESPAVLQHWRCAARKGIKTLHMLY